MVDNLYDIDMIDHSVIGIPSSRKLDMTPIYISRQFTYLYRISSDMIKDDVTYDDLGALRKIL